MIRQKHCNLRKCSEIRSNHHKKNNHKPLEKEIESSKSWIDRLKLRLSMFEEYIP